MQTRILVIWTLVLVTCWTVVLGYFSKHFSGLDLERHKALVAEMHARQLERRLAQREFSFQEYKDAVVAAGIKIQRTKGANDQLRAIASVTTDPTLKEMIQIGSPGKARFKEGRRYFREKLYGKASEVLSDFIQGYPDSPHLPEAAYLQVEALFELKKFEDCVTAVDFLISQFPETDYAAFGLLRLGQIYEELERVEDTTDVYNIILSRYPDSAAVDVAKKALEGLKP
jgi:TolA-binding protein